MAITIMMWLYQYDSFTIKSDWLLAEYRTSFDNRIPTQFQKRNSPPFPQPCWAIFPPTLSSDATSVFSSNLQLVHPPIPTLSINMYLRPIIVLNIVQMMTETQQKMCNDITHTIWMAHHFPWPSTKFWLPPPTSCPFQTFSRLFRSVGTVIKHTTAKQNS